MGQEISANLKVLDESQFLQRGKSASDTGKALENNLDVCQRSGTDE